MNEAHGRRVLQTSIIVLLVLSMIAFAVPELSRPRTGLAAFPVMHGLVPTGQLFGSARMTDGAVLVVDGDNGSIQLFDSTGRFLTGWWTPYAKASPVLRACSSFSAIVSGDGDSHDAVVGIERGGVATLTPVERSVDSARSTACPIVGSGAALSRLPLLVRLGSPALGAIGIGIASLLGLGLWLISRAAPVRASQ